MGRSLQVIFFLPLSPPLPSRGKLLLPFSGSACHHPQGGPPSPAAHHCHGLWLSLLGHLSGGVAAMGCSPVFSPGALDTWMGRDRHEPSSL